MSDDAKTAADEAKETLERQTTLSIAILAAVLAAVTLAAGNAGSDSQLAATRATDTWAHFQAKSVKEHSYELQRDFTALLPPSSGDEAKRLAFTERCTKEMARYAKEKDELKAKAEALDLDAIDGAMRNNKYGVGALLLQVGIVIASVSLLVKRRSLLLVGDLLGLAGLVVAVITATGHGRILGGA